MEVAFTQFAATLVKGPIALIFLEDDVEVASTLRHYADGGFRFVIAFGVADIQLPEDLPPSCMRLTLT